MALLSHDRAAATSGHGAAGRRETRVQHPLFDISGRVALVTGSSRGIGRALAAGLLEAGCTVVLNGRDEARLERVRAELAEQTGGRVHAVAFDVTSSEAVADAIAQAEQLAGPLDILVNNAGTIHRTPLTDVA